MAVSASHRIGLRFGLLVITRLDGRDERNRPLVVVTCDCGGSKRVRLDNVLRGGTRSCGCQGKKLGGITALHRPTYVVWKALIPRCHDPRRKDYPRYGGKGITVCDRWRASFATFLADMGPRPEGMQIDRIDSLRGYEPDNCRWVTPKANGRNRSCTRRVFFEGSEQSVPDLAERFDRDVSGVYHRLDAGWTIERALTQSGLGPYATRTKSRRATAA